MSSKAVPETGTKRGSLIIAGSGIASISHMTLESISYLKAADKVFYSVCDPVTEAYIQDNCPGAHFDLSVFYDQDKNRLESYIQMAEAMLQAVRAGDNVVGIFYGHPAICAFPTHRALALARAEGYAAKMLPGISSLDYLVADLGIDPIGHGSTSYEATDLILRDKSLDTSIYNFIWQVGSIGVHTIKFEESKVHLLVDRLERDFGSGHEIKHYIGAVYPQLSSLIDTYTIADLRKEDIANQLNMSSTLCIPPLDLGTPNPSMAIALGMADVQATIVREPAASTTYGPYEQAAVTGMDNHVIPEKHRFLRASVAMKKVMTDLALKPKFLAEYKANPSSVTHGVEGLRPSEQVALHLGVPAALYAVMTATQTELAEGREFTEDELTHVYGSSAPAHSALAHSALAHSALAHSALAHSALAHSALAHSALAHSALAHSALAHSTLAHSASAHFPTVSSAPAHSASAHFPADR